MPILNVPGLVGDRVLFAWVTARGWASRKIKACCWRSLTVSTNGWEAVPALELGAMVCQSE